MKIEKDHLKALNIKHAKSFDKWYRMLGGLSSELLSCQDSIMELEIIFDNRWPIKEKTYEGTALQIARSWKIHQELDEATTYKVYFYEYVHFEEKRANGAMINNNDPVSKVRRLLKMPIRIVEASLMN
jgi:hypothetical protein